MTRFARAKGSKASNERVPENSTPWNEMKKQLLEKNQESENFKKKLEADKQREKNYKAFLQEVDEEKTKNSKWAEFPTKNLVKKVKRSNNDSEIQEVHKKTKGGVKRKLDKTEAITGKKQQKIENVSVSETNDVIVPKKKNVKLGKQEKAKESTGSEKQQNFEAVPESSNPKPKREIKPTRLKVVPQRKAFKQKQNQNGKKMLKKLKKPAENTPLSEEDLKKIEKKKQRKLRQLERRKLKKEQAETNNSSQVTPNNSSQTTPNNSSQITPNNSSQTTPNNYSQTTPNNSSKTTPKPKKNKKNNQNNPKPERRKTFQNRMIINGKEVDIAYVDGFPIKKEDAERIKQLRGQMIGKGLPRSEIKIALKLERRKAEKSFAREKKKVCFNCRKSGHNLSECPNLGNQLAESAGTGICFKCGSTEHTHFECKVVRGQEFKFAQCFICHEQGHISRQCPDNARGLYPKGGACRVCGDVTHLKRDCPKYQAQQQQLEQSVMLETMNSDDNPDSLGQNEESVKINEFKRPNKIVKF